jgi:hypothetical protein
LAFGLAALLIVVLVLNYRITLWALADLLAAPLALVAIPLLLLLPGLALLRWLWPYPLHPAERWALALGLSAGLPPLLFLLSEPIGLRWNTWLCWAYLALAGLALAWPARGARLDLHRLRHQLRLDAEHALLIALTLVALAVQLYAGRGLPVGMFGDSYHHTMIAQLMVDHGGLFSSWQPYAPLKTFTYHYGFHSLVAWLYWLSGVPVAQGLLIVGQAEIALVVPLVYLLTRRLLGDGRAALWAAVLAGFASAMPAYYVNWGRYTQLGGQTLLPAVCVIWAALLDAAADPHARRATLLRLAALAVLATAGIVLTHYRVAVFAACFVAAYGVYLLAARLRSWRALLRVTLVALVALVLTVILVLPYVIRLRDGALLKLGSYFLSNNIGTDLTNGLGPVDVVFSLYVKWYLLALAALGAVLLLLRREWRGLALAGWGALAFLSANPYLIGLNGAGIISNFTAQIASYLLLAPLGGAAVAQIWRWAGRWLGAVGGALPLQALAGLAIVLWGIGWQQRIVAPEFQLCTPADLAAMDWIRQATPADAKFFVNAFPAYGNTLYAGSDCGWWLPLLARRASNLPPITQGTEAGEQPNYQFLVNELNAGVEQHPVSTPAAAAALRAAGFGYLYDGPDANPPGEYIQPQALASSPLYTLVYDKAGVKIWRIR